MNYQESPHGPVPNLPPCDKTSKANDGTWTFLTNHAHVLIVLARDPQMRLREVAERVRITERAVQKIVAELEAAGVLTRNKVGRRNQYTVHADQRLRHPVESHCAIGDLIRMVHGEASAPECQAPETTPQ